MPERITVGYSSSVSVVDACIELLFQMVGPRNLRRVAYALSTVSETIVSVVDMAEDSGCETGSQERGSVEQDGQQRPVCLLGVIRVSLLHTLSPARRC